MWPNLSQLYFHWWKLTFVLVLTMNISHLDSMYLIVSFVFRNYSCWIFNGKFNEEICLGFMYEGVSFLTKFVKKENKSEMLSIHGRAGRKTAHFAEFKSICNRKCKEDREVGWWTKVAFIAERGVPASSRHSVLWCPHHCPLLSINSPDAQLFRICKCPLVSLCSLVSP